MQNHPPYSDWYSDNQFKDADTTNLPADEKTGVDTYIKGVSITDQATTDFLNQLDAIDQPITVIFYGDHLPGVYTTARASSKNTITMQETDYFIWSNEASASAGTKLDPAAAATSYTSPNYFMAMASDHMNTKYLLILRSSPQCGLRYPPRSDSRLVSAASPTIHQLSI